MSRGASSGPIRRDNSRMPTTPMTSNTAIQQPHLEVAQRTLELGHALAGALLGSDRKRQVTPFLVQLDAQVAFTRCIFCHCELQPGTARQRRRTGQIRPGLAENASHPSPHLLQGKRGAGLAAYRLISALSRCASSLTCAVPASSASYPAIFSCDQPRMNHASNRNIVDAAQVWPTSYLRCFLLLTRLLQLSYQGMINNRSIGIMFDKPVTFSIMRCRSRCWT